MPVGGDFRPSDGEAVLLYFVYGKRIRRSRAEIYPCPSMEIFVPTCRGRRPDVPSARQRRAARLPPCGAVDAARRRRFSSQPVGDGVPTSRQRGSAALQGSLRVGLSMLPVGGDFRPSDGEAVLLYFVYGKRIRRSWGGNNPDGGYIHMAKSLNTVPITLLHTGRCAMRSGVISAERDMVLSMSSSSASMAGTP